MSEDYERNQIITVNHITQGGGPFPYPNDAYERAFRVLKHVFDPLGGIEAPSLRVLI